MSFRKSYGIVVVFLILAAVGAALTLSRAGTALTTGADSPAQRIYVIDAGHGGEDGGAVSTTGNLESQLNLAFSLRLDAMLRFLGGRTVLVRTKDISISTEGETIAQRKVSDIHNRVALVEATPNAVLVSIHQNFFPQTQYRGAQVFYNADGEVLANALQSALAAHLDQENHRCAKPASEVYLMTHVTCPAVLVECGFLSNFQEEQHLQDAVYQKKFTAVLAATLLRALEDTNEV